MNRRGFFAALLSIPAVLRARPKPKPRVLYMDTDSVCYDRALSDGELRLLFKYEMNALYGKIGVPQGTYDGRPKLLGVYLSRS